MIKVMLMRHAHFFRLTKIKEVNGFVLWFLYWAKMFFPLSFDDVALYQSEQLSMTGLVPFKSSPRCDVTASVPHWNSSREPTIVGIPLLTSKSEHG